MLTIYEILLTWWLHLLSVSCTSKIGLTLFPVPLCVSIPFQYERMFGPLPYAEDGVELFRVFESLPVCVETSDPSNLEKAVLRKAQGELCVLNSAQTSQW